MPGDIRECGMVYLLGIQENFEGNNSQVKLPINEAISSRGREIKEKPGR